MRAPRDPVQQVEQPEWSKAFTIKAPFILIFIAFTVAVTTVSCSGDSPQATARAQAQHVYLNRNTIIPKNNEIVLFSPSPTEVRPSPQATRERNAYFGDLHVHTGLSLDAYAFGATASPAQAYRYAQGEAITHPSGFEVKLAQPLDFYAVTDHGFFLGLLNATADTRTPFSREGFAVPYHDLNESVEGGLLDIVRRLNVYSNFKIDIVAGLLDGSLSSRTVEKIGRSAWQETVRAANDAYQPGVFTTFAGYEFTPSTAERESIHRNVIFRGGDRLPVQPFSRLNSINPEGLWNWMDALRGHGVESLAIPHNSNSSNGAMFMFTDWAGNPVDQAYAEQRLRNEPLVEITQVKGTSDTHPLLSKNDEWAGFGILPLSNSTKLPSEPRGSYARNAWLRGLSIADRATGNPYKFGVIGSSDTHTGAASLYEDNYFGKIGVFDGTAEMRGSIPASFLYGTLVKLVAPEMIDEVDGETYLNFSEYKLWGASGIAGVWAEENTREGIYDALRRKETFATSGTRIKVRFFAGYGLGDSNMDSPGLIETAYRDGTTMGGSIKAEGLSEPAFLAWAIADPRTAQLQRIQIIKGWLEGGEHREKVYDVACSDGMHVDPKTHRCPGNGAGVNLQDCSTTANVGAPELKALWRDPEFTPGQEAFYYVRVLENPVCRWSTWDAIRAGKLPRSDLPATIQERAWSSPIWYGATHSSDDVLE